MIQVGDKVRVEKPHPYAGHTGYVSEISDRPIQREHPFMVILWETKDSKLEIGCSEKELTLLRETVSKYNRE